jgi:hypothetical protein
MISTPDQRPTGQNISESAPNSGAAAPAVAIQTQNQKGVIIATLITAVATVAVSFVGIVPQLRNNDAKAFAQTLADFKKQSEDALNAMQRRLDVSEKNIGVNGTVYSDATHKKPLSGIEVYLLPEGNNLMTAKTDDAGKFVLPKVPVGTYSIIVRDPSAGRSGKALLDDGENEVTVIGAAIKYHIEK